MNLDELKCQWQADRPGAGRDRRTEAEMMEAIRLNARRFDRKILLRDWLETAAAVIVVAVFAAAMPFVGGLARTGLAIIIASCFYIAWRLHTTRRRHGTARPDQPMAMRLRLELRKLDDQIKLLRNVHWWYLGPLGVGLVVYSVGIDGWTLGTLWFVLGVVIVYTAIYWLNQRSVRRELLPRRLELASMLDTLEDRRDGTDGEDEDA